MSNAKRCIQVRSTSGFTLVELLVVIGIIALLISILMPSLQKARQAAIAVTCGTQERQIGQALQMYMSENHGMIPYAYITLPDDAPYSHSGWVISWDDMLDSYLSRRHLSDTDYKWVPNKDCPILRCPADINIQPFSGVGAGKFRRTYSMNGNPDYSITAANTGNNANTPGRGVCSSTGALKHADGGGLKYPGNRHIKISEIKDVSGTMMLSEVPMDQNVIGYGGPALMSAPSTQLKQVSKGLHNGKFNYLFCDGHVELLNPLATFGETGSFTDPRGMWTRDPND